MVNSVDPDLNFHLEQFDLSMARVEYSDDRKGSAKAEADSVFCFCILHNGPFPML